MAATYWYTPPKPDRSKPRTFSWLCKGPECKGEIGGTDTMPDWYTAVPCWACGSDEHTTPRPLPREEAPS